MNSTDLLTLKLAGSGSEVTIAPLRGAIVTSLRLHGRELLYLDEATFRDPGKNVRGGIPVLFPAPGKLQGDHWQWQGRQGDMKQHGFARNCAWTVVSAEDAAATLALQSDASTLAQYPWPFEARLRFELGESSLRIITSVRNCGSEPMPFACGFHPYFAVTDKARAQIRSEATLAFNNLTQSTEPFAGFDLAAPEVDLHLIDHPHREMTLELGDGAAITVRATPDYRRWVVWTLAGKSFVCVEPWTAPGNALNTGEKLFVLAPGSSHETWVEVVLRDTP
jgi:galactose mutarotase-like enzyme